jgi:hypothetical protein
VSRFASPALYFTGATAQLGPTLACFIYAYHLEGLWYEGGTRGGDHDRRRDLANDARHPAAARCRPFEDVQKAAGHRDPGTTKLYDRRGYNPEKAASFFATY